MEETVTREQTDDKSIGRDVDYTSSVDGTEKETTSETGIQKINEKSTNNTVTSSTQKTTLEHGEVVTTDDVNDSNGTSKLEHGETVDHNDTLDNYQYGFNSTEKIPTTTSIDTASDVHSGTDTTTTTNHSTEDISVTHSGTDTTDTTYNSTVDVTGSIDTDATTTNSGESDTSTTQARADKTTDNTVENGKTNESITRKRVGNIGVTSSQDLLLQEIELWKWNFYQQVFEDVDKYLALQYYASL